MPTNHIRNISQTVQDREIVKTAPDLVVHIEGLPYLLNYFVNDQNSGNSFTIVNFNNHVTNFNATYDVDMLVPSASINLQVPNYERHLYQMPGGNNLVQSMMQVQVYAKGYFLSNSGKTVYRRVFKGLVVHASHTDNGKTLDITLQCKGTLYFFELMQVALSPAVMHNGPVGAVPFQSIFAFNNPYLYLMALFVTALDTSTFQFGSVQQKNLQSEDFATAVQSGYITKWQTILDNLAKDVHIYGVSFKDIKSIQSALGGQAKVSSVFGSVAKNELADANAIHALKTEQAQREDVYFNKIRQYHPDMLINMFQLVNGKIVSRMEQFRHVVQMINFEGYQDIDGQIIVKPPLYNLDVTYLGSRTLQSSQQPGDPYFTKNNPDTEIYESSNPFVINLSEILTESESEDEASIKKTRMTVVGSLMPSMPGVNKVEVYQVADYIDIPKLQKFGLREEPVKQVPWFKEGDKLGLYAHAAAETVRANRSYRTYSVTIPMRPELKVGFPVYFPHKDMYGYIKQVTLNYQIAGTATMTVMCDTLRRRVLVPSVQQNPDGKKFTHYTSAPNLVFRWTTSGVKANKLVPNPNQSPSGLDFFQTYFQQISGGGGLSTNDANPSQPIGKPGTTTSPVKPSDDQQALRAYTQKVIGSSWGQEVDSDVASYRIQQDSDALFTRPQGQNRLVDDSYMRDIRHTFPYTDAKGYELVGPFPWGRYQDLRTTIKEFTQDGYIVPPDQVNTNATEILQNTEAFIFAGLGTPTATSDTATSLIRALKNVSQDTDTDAVFVLDYSNTDTNDNKLLNTAQPQDSKTAVSAQIANTQNVQKQLIDVLVTGSIAPVKAVQDTLASTTTVTPRAIVDTTPTDELTQPKEFLPATGSTPGPEE